MSALERITLGSHTYYSIMFFIAYTSKVQVHMFGGRCCKSLDLQGKSSIYIFFADMGRITLKSNALN